MLKSFLISFMISLFLILFGASIRKQSERRAEYLDKETGFYECINAGESQETCKNELNF